MPVLAQQLGASKRHLRYLLLHDLVGEEVRHPVDESEPQIVCREVVCSEQLQVYARSDMLERRRTLMQQWNDYIT